MIRLSLLVSCSIFSYTYIFLLRDRLKNDLKSIRTGEYKTARRERTYLIKRVEQPWFIRSKILSLSPRVPGGKGAPKELIPSGRVYRINGCDKTGDTYSTLNYA